MTTTLEDLKLLADAMGIQVEVRMHPTVQADMLFYKNSALPWMPNVIREQAQRVLRYLGREGFEYVLSESWTYAHYYEFSVSSGGNIIFRGSSPADYPELVVQGAVAAVKSEGV